MALYLVQHGLSLSKEEDPERGLSEAGIAEVSRIADQASESGVQVSGVRHSGKKRARQTAEIMAAKLLSGGEVEEISGLGPLEDVAALSDILGLDQNDGNRLMLVGHLPFMEKMASYLLTGSAGKTVVKFQNGGIVCLNKDSALGPWYLKWSLVPSPVS